MHPASPPTWTRYDIIKNLAPELKGKVVVSNLGIPSKELYSILHQPSNFYMRGSMGMATPIGLGVALASRKEVVVIDGDGSRLMNPGTLATVAAAAPENLTVIAIDNGAYGSTGNQPTLAASCGFMLPIAMPLDTRVQLGTETADFWSLPTERLSADDRNRISAACGQSLTSLQQQAVGLGCML